MINFTAHWKARPRNAGDRFAARENWQTRADGWTSTREDACIEVRTNNQDEMTADGKIGPQWQKFYSQNILAQIPHKKNNDIFAVYTDYDSDVNGEYSYILGAEVDALADIPLGFVGRKISAAKYAVFSYERGAIPGIIIDVWKRVWNFKAAERAYQADFEVYGRNSSDPQNAQVDVYLSIQ